MNTTLSSDLNSVKAEFDTWRTQNTGRKLLPKELWTAAVALLTAYSVEEVSQQLNINPKQLRKLANAQDKIANPSPIPPTQKAFLEVAAQDFAPELPLKHQDNGLPAKDSSCRIILERQDGSRLSLSLPVDWQHIYSLCQGFWKA